MVRHGKREGGRNECGGGRAVRYATETELVCAGLLRIITGASNAATIHFWLALYLRRRRRRRRWR